MSAQACEHRLRAAESGRKGALWRGSDRTPGACSHSGESEERRFHMAAANHREAEVTRLTFIHVKKCLNAISHGGIGRTAEIEIELTRATLILSPASCSY